MSRRNTVNLIVVVLVILVVAGTAWRNRARSVPEVAPPGPTSLPAAGVATRGSGPTATRAALPAAAPAQPATRPASQPASAPAGGLPRLVDLGADKCKACKELAPILHALREEYKGRLVVEFHDVWKDPAPARKFGVRLIPTQILLDRAGREVWRHEGFISKEDLRKLFAEKVGVK